MTSSAAVTEHGLNILRAVAPPPVSSSTGGNGPPEEGYEDDDGGGDRERHRILVLLAVYVRARLSDRRGNRTPRKVNLWRVREISGLPAAYVEELAAELVEEGRLEYRPDTRPGILKPPRWTYRGFGTRESALETTFVSLTQRGFDYPGLDRACELLLGTQKRREEVVHHLTMPRRFFDDLRSEDSDLRDYAWSMTACLGMCTLVSLTGSVALVLEVIS